jgi:hypothetical protein
VIELLEKIEKKTLGLAVLLKPGLEVPENTLGLYAPETPDTVPGLTAPLTADA